MSDIRYEHLAGPYYIGLDNINKAEETYIQNSLHTYAIPAIHPSFIDKDKAVGPPGVKRIKETHTINDFGNPIVLKEETYVYRDPFHSFRYFETMGTVYGSHNIIMDYSGPEDNLGFYRERWQSEPIHIERLDKLNIDANLSSFNSTEDACAMTMIVNATKLGVTFEDEFTHSENGEDFFDIFIGEYHLLPNSPSGIYRCNISWDIHPFTKSMKDAQKEVGSYRAISDGESKSEIYSSLYGAGVSFSNEDEGSSIVRKMDISPNESHFAEYYIGTSKVSKLGSRPKDMQNKNISMRHPRYMEAGSQIRWKSMRDSCVTWNRIYDGTNISDIINSDIIKPGHYIMNTAIKINATKLKSYIESLHSGVETNVRYKIVLYMPTFSVLAHDSVEEIRYPKISSFIDMFDQLDFIMPNNYKSGGAYHFTIHVYDKDKETLLYKESSLPSEPVYVNLPKTKVHIRRGRWYHLVGWDDNTMEEFGSDKIRFNSDYYSKSGVNHESYNNIRYSPSNDLSAFINLNSGVYIKITTHDGTLREEYGYTTKIRN